MNLIINIWWLNNIIIVKTNEIIIIIKRLQKWEESNLKINPRAIIEICNMHSVNYPLTKIFNLTIEFLIWIKLY